MRDFWPEVPLQVPRRPGLGIAQLLARTTLRVCGWRFVGLFPNEPKLVMIAAPHSSAWDAIWGLLIKLAFRMDIVFLGKKEIFVGPLGWLLRRMGGVPVNRGTPDGVVQQMADLILQKPRLWLVLAPEGTRRKVTMWKPGFWRIAKAANVPILCAYFHYPEKLIGVGPLFWPSDDFDADMQMIRQWYKPWMGKHRGTV